MALHRDSTRSFDQKLRLVAAVTDLNPGIEALRTKLREFDRKPRRPMLDRLADAVINNSTDIDTLWALALAEAASTPPLHNELLTNVRSRIHNRIRDTYAADATTTYRHIATQFDAAATKLTQAVTVVEPEMPAEQIIDRPTKDQAAWKAAAVHAADLTRLLPSLTAAARLADIITDAEDDVVALAVEAGDCHRRQLWEAWECEHTAAVARRTAENNQPFTTAEIPNRNRTGRWGALLTIGATIRACNPEDFQPYRRPRPLIERTLNEPGGPVTHILDPEDDGFQEPPTPTFTSPRARVVKVGR